MAGCREGDGYCAVVKLPFWPSASALALMAAVSPPAGDRPASYGWGRDCFAAGAAVRAGRRRYGAWQFVGLGAEELARRVSEVAAEHPGPADWVPLRPGEDTALPGVQRAGLALQLYGWSLWRGAFDDPGSGGTADPAVLAGPLASLPRGTTARAWSQHWLAVAERALGASPRTRPAALCLLPGWVWALEYRGPLAALADADDEEGEGVLAELTPEAREYVMRCADLAPEDGDVEEYAWRCVEAFGGPILQTLVTP